MCESSPSLCPWRSLPACVFSACICVSWPVLARFFSVPCHACCVIFCVVLSYFPFAARTPIVAYRIIGRATRRAARFLCPHLPFFRAARKQSSRNMFVWICLALWTCLPFQQRETVRIRVRVRPLYPRRVPVIISYYFVPVPFDMPLDCVLLRRGSRPSFSFLQFC